MNQVNKIIAILLIIIFGLITYIIINGNTTEVIPFDETALREQLRLKDSTALYWQNQALYNDSIAVAFENKSDSLELLKSTTNEKYNKEINFNSSASIIQLDSIIRSSW